MGGKGDAAGLPVPACGGNLAGELPVFSIYQHFRSSSLCIVLYDDQSERAGGAEIGRVLTV